MMEQMRRQAVISSSDRGHMLGETPLPVVHKRMRISWNSRRPYPLSCSPTGAKRGEGRKAVQRRSRQTTEI